MTDAVVFVLSKYLEQDAPQCFDYCKTMGYVVAGLVRDDWTAAMMMIGNGLATVVVVAREDHLDPRREPRIEVVAHIQNEDPRQARTRIIRRNAAG